MTENKCTCEHCAAPMPNFSNISEHAILALGMMAARVVINGSTDYSDWEFVPYGEGNGQCVNRCKDILQAIHESPLGYSAKWAKVALTPNMREVKYWGVHTSHPDSPLNEKKGYIITFTSQHEALSWFASGEGYNKSLFDKYYPNVANACEKYGIEYDTVWNKEVL